MAKKEEAKYTISVEAARLKKKESTSLTEYQKQQLMLGALEETSGHLAAETDIHLILSRMAESLLEVLGARYVNFWDFTPDKKGLFITAAAGMQRQYLEHSRKIPIRLGTAWVGRAVATKKAWATADVQKDSRLPRSWLPPVKKQNYHGLLCMPLMRKGEPVGGMCIYYKEVHHFEYFEMSLASIVANQAATAVANAKLFSELLAEKNKTLATIRSLKDGLVMYDLDGKVLLFNPKAQEFLWLREEDVINQQINEALSQRSVYFKNLYQIKSLAQSDFETKEYITEGPQKLVLEVTYVPVREQYRKIGEMQILRDITREKEVEMLKSSFVSVASHQLRTPLSAIKWSLDGLIKGDWGALSSQQKEIIEEAFSANERLINLVRDLLDVSRIEEGRFGYNFVLGGLEALVDKIYKELQPLAQSHQLDFVVEKPVAPLPKIMFDSDKLDIAIRNVLDNAIKYTLPYGFVRVKFQTGVDGKFLFLNIEDNGIGIPAKDQKFIFVKFFRARNAIKRETQGSGLGLYIAKKIAEKHGAALFFESVENRGSAFVFRFPLEPVEMPKAMGDYPGQT